MPIGNQATFANRTLPEAVVVLVRDIQPINLVMSVGRGRASSALTVSMTVWRSSVSSGRPSSARSTAACVSSKLSDIVDQYLSLEQAGDCLGREWAVEGERRHGVRTSPAIWQDGDYSYSEHPHSVGTCHGHGGVAQYLL
jgi:hypothetical protein